jgi:5-formyltetrahydrofolate cyclo-ligase
MMDKITLRADIFAKLQTLSHKDIQHIDQEITRRVLALPAVQKANVICIYESFGREVDTKNLIHTFRLQEKVIVIPPKDFRLLESSNIELWIVPGVAFDPQGNRLGRGSGYYDRVLAGIDTPIIGIAREIQIVPRLPKEKYDIPITTVITEKNIYGQQTP